MSKSVRDTVIIVKPWREWTIFEGFIYSRSQSIMNFGERALVVSVNKLGSKHSKVTCIIAYRKSAHCVKK